MYNEQDIPLYTTTSHGWHNENEPSPYLVGLNAGINEYQFSRPTPDNKFMTSTELIKDNNIGIQMVGGKPLKNRSKVVKKDSTLLKKYSKVVKKDSKPVKNSSKPVKNASMSLKNSSKTIEKKGKSIVNWLKSLVK